MRRLLSVAGLIGLGLLLGFFIRLVWPRSSMPVYSAPPPLGATTQPATAERRSG